MINCWWDENRREESENFKNLGQSKENENFSLLTSVLVARIRLIWIASIFHALRLRWRWISNIFWRLILPRVVGKGGRRRCHGRLNGRWRVVVCVSCVCGGITIGDVWDINLWSIILRRWIKGVRCWVSFKLLLSSKSARPSTETSFVFKHVLGTRINCPVMSFAGFSALFWQLFKAL